MSQQFRIDSEALRDKINSLLPSQARGSINVDLTGQTTIVPIVDLTETAEGSNIRADLQTSLSLSSITTFSFSNTNGTIVNTTGYYRVFGVSTLFSNSSQLMVSRLTITDGISSKDVFNHIAPATGAAMVSQGFDFIILLKAGDSLTGTSLGPTTFGQLQGNVRQIATLAGDLVNP